MKFDAISQTKCTKQRMQSLWPPTPSPSPNAGVGEQELVPLALAPQYWGGGADQAAQTIREMV